MFCGNASGWSPLGAIARSCSLQLLWGTLVEFVFTLIGKIARDSGTNTINIYTEVNPRPTHTVYHRKDPPLRPVHCLEKGSCVNVLWNHFKPFKGGRFSEVMQERPAIAASGSWAASPMGEGLLFGYHWARIHDCIIGHTYECYAALSITSYCKERTIACQHRPLASHRPAPFLLLVNVKPSRNCYRGDPWHWTRYFRYSCSRWL